MTFAVIVPNCALLGVAAIVTSVLKRGFLLKGNG